MTGPSQKRFDAYGNVIPIFVIQMLRRREVRRAQESLTEA